MTFESRWVLLALMVPLHAAVWLLFYLVLRPAATGNTLLGVLSVAVGMCGLYYAGKGAHRLQGHLVTRSSSRSSGTRGN